MSNQNELLILHGQLLAGDVRASSKIVALTIAPLVSIVMRDVRGLHDVQDVEETCFDALFKYLTAPQKYDPQRAELITYLVAIAKGKAMTLRRTQTHRSEYEGKYAALEDVNNDPLASADDENAVIHRIDWSKFGAVLVEDPGDAEIISLMKTGTHSPVAIAKALGLKQDAVGLAEAKKRMERIRGRARRMIERKEA